MVSALQTWRGRLRALLPPIGPKLVFLALLGVLVFLCGIVFGFWLIIRHRRGDSPAPR